MNLKTALYTTAASLLVLSCSPKTTVSADFSDVIPRPLSVVSDSVETAPFVIDASTVISYPEGDTVLARQASLLAGYIAGQTGIEMKTSGGYTGRGRIVLASGAEGKPEGYNIDVCADSLVIRGTNPPGTFYGIQTLRKAVPVARASRVICPAGKVADEPRFSYRGAHFDVSRHFFPADSVRKFIDLLAMHNVNRLHLHLTDDHGWRMEVPSRPRLTEVGSRRKCSIIGHSASDYDSVPVEGFYTRAELRELVRYASDRCIEIIPEIDIPGHMMAALASYPELGCTGGPYEVKTRWDGPVGVVCAGNDSVYSFLRDVFGEVVEIFPSELVHIGGDEVQKDDWKACPRCQARATALGLRDDDRGTREQKLQNHVMKYIADFLREKGRRVIGWDEVLDADFAPDAVVMSWRGEEGGVNGARKGHQVIMTPSRYLYFDFYQTTDIASEPVAIGGYTPVDLVYNYEPRPEGLTDSEASLILGAQANLWTEYIKDFPHAMYMELPRLAALSEIQWCLPDRKDYRDFIRRLPRMLRLYDNGGYPYARHVFDVRDKIEADPEAKVVRAVLYTDDDAPVHYTLDGSLPDASSPVYRDTIVVDGPVKLRAVAIRDGKPGKCYEGGITFSKATFRPVELSVEPHPRYTFGGASALVDGRLGSGGYADGLWLGFPTPVIDFTVDLESPQMVSEVSFRSLVNTDSWIFPPRRVSVSVSDDGREFREVYTSALPALEGGESSIRENNLGFEPVETRYVRLNVASETSMPSWHPGGGRQAFFFIDEISVE